jgi:DNA-binding response OmpR family regulator
MTSSRDILVVDDDRKTVELIALYLRHGGYSVRVAYDGARALALVRERTPDLLVLDLMLPQLDGLDVCHALRTDLGMDVPVIMLTARTTEQDKLVGLETGADDYVTKPFSPRELVARVKAVLRRGGTGDNNFSLAFGDLEIDLARREVRRAKSCGSRPASLTFSWCSPAHLDTRSRARACWSARSA